MKKHTPPAHPRAIAMLMAAVALPLTPVLAQEASPPPVATIAAPPPVAAAPATPPAPVFAAPAPVIQNVPPPGPRTPVVAEAPAPEAAAPAPRRAPRAAARAPIARSAPAARPAAVAPPAAEAPVPATEASAEPAPVPVADIAPEPAVLSPAPTDSPVAVTQDTDRSTPWLLIGLVALGAILLVALFARRRGRRDAVRDDRVYEASVLAPNSVTPANYAPVAPVPEEAVPVAAAGDSRPWVGLSFAPIRAGTDGDDTLVEYELTVENSSDVAAHDVRVSSFLINGAQPSANEQSLIRPMGEAQSRTVDILPNGSVPIAATIHVNRAALNGDTFSPKVVAEVRYPLPGGGEGLFSARFALGIADGDGIRAVGLSDGMHDNVGARLDEVLEQA